MFFLRSFEEEAQPLSGPMAFTPWENPMGELRGGEAAVRAVQAVQWFFSLGNCKKKKKTVVMAARDPVVFLLGNRKKGGNSRIWESLELENL